MSPDLECRLMIALSLHPGTTSKHLAQILGWSAGLTSQRLLILFDHRRVRRERIVPCPVLKYSPANNGSRIEYRYWLEPFGAGPTMPMPPARSEFELKQQHERSVSEQNCIALAREADRLTAQLEQQERQHDSFSAGARRHRDRDSRIDQSEPGSVPPA
jgi:hypothetical protein